MFFLDDVSLPESSPLKGIPEYLHYIEDLPTSSNDKYEIICRLGRGAFGAISLARDIEGRKYAIKTKITREHKVTNMERKEIHALKVLENEEHIVKMVDIIRDDENMSIVMPVARTDLRRIREEGVEMGESERRSIIFQLLKGLSAIHKHGLIHRDIKPANVLVTRDGLVQICDFNSSTPCFADQGDATKKLSPFVGTQCYSAIEMLLGDEQYKYKVDIWSAGCLATELWTKECLFDPTLDRHSIVKSIAEICGFPKPAQYPRVTSLDKYEYYADKLAIYDKDLVHQTAMRITAENEMASDLLTRMLKLNPEHRTSADDALSHDYFTKSPLESNIKSFMDRISGKNSGMAATSSVV